MPEIQASAIVAIAAQRYETTLLEKVDEHTIRCKIADITFVPLPVPDRRRIAGLLTVQLPPHVKAGEEYSIIVRQHATHLQQIVGQFQLTIPVGMAEQLRSAETRWLRVMRSIGASIRPTSRWFAVFERYIHVTENRLRAFGGDPDHLPPEGLEDVEGITDRRGCVGSLVWFLARPFFRGHRLTRKYGRHDYHHDGAHRH